MTSWNTGISHGFLHLYIICLNWCLHWFSWWFLMFLDVFNAVISFGWFLQCYCVIDFTICHQCFFDWVFGGFLVLCWLLHITSMVWLCLVYFFNGSLKNVSWHRWPPEILGFPMVFFIYYMFILMSSLVFMVVLDVSWCFQCCYFTWLISSVLLLYWFHHMSSMLFWLGFRWLSCALLITSYYFNGLVMLDLLLQRFFEKCKLA